MKAKAIVCTVPNERKADAVQKTLRLPVANSPCPATILRTHPQNWFFLDFGSASLLDLGNSGSESVQKEEAKPPTVTSQPQPTLTRTQHQYRTQRMSLAASFIRQPPPPFFSNQYTALIRTGFNPPKSPPRTLHHSQSLAR